MKDNEIINEMNNSLPEGAERSLCSCGGINGLVGLLPEDSDIEALSLIYRALADSNRIKILAMLEVQPLCVCVIKAVLGIADSKLSYHLSILKKADFISGEQKGTWITYRITDKGRKWFDSGQSILSGR